ncbi:MAG: hypothetical protein H7141_06245 [Burkholderiales bacterium]|nr:hypothetical protein [Bacteroidia bacterium]
MKKLILFASVLTLTSITNKISSQNASNDLEATIISISPDKSKGLASSLKTGEVFQFVNTILTDVLPNDKVIMVALPSIDQSTGYKKARITFGGGSTMIDDLNGLIR